MWAWRNRKGPEFLGQKSNSLHAVHPTIHSTLGVWDIRLPYVYTCIWSKSPTAFTLSTVNYLPPFSLWEPGNEVTQTHMCAKRVYIPSPTHTNTYTHAHTQACGPCQTAPHPPSPAVLFLILALPHSVQSREEEGWDRGQTASDEDGRPPPGCCWGKADKWQRNFQHEVRGVWGCYQINGWYQFQVSLSEPKLHTVYMHIHFRPFELFSFLWNQIQSIQTENWLYACTHTMHCSFH